jgi:hypothetical protein
MNSRVPPTLTIHTLIVSLASVRSQHAPQHWVRQVKKYPGSQPRSPANPEHDVLRGASTDGDARRRRHELRPWRLRHSSRDGFAQEWVREQVDLANGQVVGGAPIGVDQPELLSPSGALVPSRASTAVISHLPLFLVLINASLAPPEQRQPRRPRRPRSRARASTACRLARAQRGRPVPGPAQAPATSRGR